MNHDFIGQLSKKVIFSGTMILPYTWTMFLLPAVIAQQIYHLNITTTACRRNCIIYDKRQTCPATVHINGRQVSPAQDGFNVMSLDMPTGAVASDYFRWFRRTYKPEGRDFRRWFRDLNNGSVVVVVLQNMCSYFDQQWYRYLQVGPVKVF